MHQPTAPELELLKLLWKKEPRTARELHDELSEQFDWSYSTTRKTLERMGEKGFVLIESVGNKKSYTAKLEKVKILAQFASDFASRILEIDSPLPVAMFADSKLIDSSEIKELEKMLEKLAREGKS
ncbi:BlaI/MecI/CopY family transcriptional regulator [Aliikangiella coralliicola]|uniref:BlaI/MecI/CopY family transcriptional regulator n=1 Tax=Aliikangiella coralliicola TaxID=2592383 RepID=A0A545UJ09_9GAMM|nr:BlaI/MecI/CopY family transcriptional regulator [Aliikangiella coralliicola]TQV89448.1 BlaI/MecI/CopY family transcriptional regulator [Aliikangiella coralliicola]